MTDNRIITASDIAETEQLARILARSASENSIFLLSGAVGAGKSVFARAFVRELCGAETVVPSPTFTIVQQYDHPGGRLYHFDLYRLEDPSEIVEAGWEEALADGIVLAEWPERLGPYWPVDAVSITIKTREDDKRDITIHAP